MRAFHAVLGNTARGQRDVELPLVRPHLLGLPRDPLGDGDGDHRRRVHAVHRPLRHLLRHARRPPPQEAGDGRVVDDHPRGLRGGRRAVAAPRRGPARGVGEPVVLAVHPRDPGRQRGREHAQHRAVDHGDVARPGGRARQGQRARRHRPGHRVHDHQRVQRPQRRPARHGLDGRHRGRADRRLAAPPAADHGPGGRARPGGGRLALRRARRRPRDPRGAGTGRAASCSRRSTTSSAASTSR